jgi:hypothetical protein
MSEEIEALRISWSQIRSSSECKQKAHLQRMKKDSPHRDLRMFTPGTVVDLVMRRWLEGEAALGNMPEMVEEILNKEEVECKEKEQGIIKWKDKTDKKTVIAFCQDACRKLEPILVELALPFNYEPAKRFKVPVLVPYLDGCPTVVELTGEMDLLTRDTEGQLGLWDLKITQNSEYWRKVLGQLVFYSIVLESMFGYSPSKVGLIQPVTLPQVMEFSVDEQLKREMWVRIQRYATQRWLKDYEPKESTAGCSWCSVNHACIRYAGDKDRRMTALGTGSILD